MWFNIDVDTNMLADEAPMHGDQHGHALVFTKIMQASRVDGRSHGVVR